MQEDPEDGIFEYLLVFEIPKRGFFNWAVSVNEHIQEKFALEKYKEYHPHLTALLTCLHDLRESQFIHFLQEVADSLSPFDVIPLSIKGFDHSLVIYVDVEDKQPFLEIDKKLRKKLKGIVKPYKSLKFNRTFDPRYTKDPHITIVKDLNEVLYEKILTALQSENYNFESFCIDQMVLFKKRLGPYRNKKIAVFKFLGRPEDQYIQGSLFSF